MTQSLGVLVGVQDLQRSLRSLDWAARQAAATGRVLTICHVLPADPADLTVPLVLRTAQAERARVLVELAAARAKEVDAHLPVERRVERGPVSAVLQSYAGAADEVVLGVGRSGHARRLGSVALYLSSHAPCPVTVVCGRRPDRSTVVAALDGSDRDRSTLDYAFRYAQAHGLSVQAMHAYQMEPPPPATTYHPGRQPQTAAHDAMRETLATVDPWTVKYPDVPTTTAISAGEPADVLLEVSAGAELLVLGGIGRRGIGGLILGSVSQRLLARSTCPITIAR